MTGARTCAKGFAECFRVLKPDGILVFKWNECQVKLKDVLRLTEEQPLIGDRRGKTHWMNFYKGRRGRMIYVYAYLTAWLLCNTFLLALAIRSDANGGIYWAIPFICGAVNNNSCAD